MWRKVLAAFSLLLILIICAVLFGAEKLATTVAVRALDAAGFELTFDNFELNPLAGTLAVSNLVLIEHADNKLLLSIDQANLNIVPLELLQGENTAGVLDAWDIDIYLYPGEDVESESSWEPGTWLGYRKLLPGNVSIENLSLHWPGNDPKNITRLATIKFSPGEDIAQTILTLEALHNGADLHIAGEIDTVERLDGGLSGVGVKLEVSSEHYQSSLKMEGAMQGSGSALRYTLRTEAHSPDIGNFLHSIDINFDLHGVTKIKGELEGNLEGFSLKAQEVSLDYLPEYHFLGSGQFSYEYNGDSDLDLDMQGELESLGQLITWMDLDVAELGSAKASFKLQGSLEDPVLKDTVITTLNEQGLQIELSGGVRIKNLNNNSLDGEDGIHAVVSAPNLAALQPWTGELEFDTGPWRMVAHARQENSKVVIRNIGLQAEGEAGASLSIEGQIGDAGSLLEGDIAGLKDIVLQASLNSPSSKQLTDFAGLDAQNLGPLTASATIVGSGDDLKVQKLQVETGSDGVQVKLSDGSVQLVLAPEFSYNNANFPVSVDIDSTARLSQWVDYDIADQGKIHNQLTVRQTTTGFGLPFISTEVRRGQTVIISQKGSIEELSPLKGLKIAVQLNGLATAGLIGTFTDYNEADLDAGQLYGSYDMASFDKGFQINNIELENRNSDQLKFDLDGRLQWGSGLVDMNLHLETEISDTALLAEVTGLELAALKGDLHISGSQHSIAVKGSTHLGSTELVSRLLLTVADEGLTDIKGSVTTAQLNLQDLGLGAVIAEDQVAVEKAELQEQKLSAIQSSRDQVLPLDALPNFPIDLVLAAAKMEGRLFSAENFSVHVRTGNDRYELINLVLRYTGGEARINASLDIGPEIPDWSVNAQLEDFSIERLRDLGAPGNITGNVNTLLALESQGDTLKQLLAEMDGNIAIAFEDIRLKGAAYDRLAVDTVAWFYTGGVLQEETRFSCVMGVFDVSQGIATSEFLLAESDYLVADGNATINLPTAELDVAITPRSKARTFQIPGTIRVTGPWSDPKISTSPVSKTVDASAQVLLLAPSVAFGMFDRTVSLFGGDDDATGEETQARKCPQPSEQKVAE